jgi:hypothetical protein
MEATLSKTHMEPSLEVMPNLIQNGSAVRESRFRLSSPRLKHG